MNDNQLLKNFMELPEQRGKFKNRKHSKFWKIVHLFGCPEKYLTEPYVMRYCNRCGRILLNDPELRKAYRKGGFLGMIQKQKEIKRSTQVGLLP